MKRLLFGLFASGFLTVNSAQAETYYWNGSGAINMTSSWGTNTDGTGTNPLNFTTAGNTFIIKNGQSAALNNAWTISGTGSGLTIQEGGVFNAGSNNPTLILNLESGARYTIGTGSYGNLTLGTINSNSTIEITSTSFRDLSYGNLKFTPTGTLTPGNVNISGNLTIASGTVQGATTTTSRSWTIGSGGSGDINVSAGAIFRLNNAGSTDTATATFNIAGGLLNDGTINKNSAGTTATTINFNGTGSSDIKWGTVTNTGFSTVTINIGSSKTITFLDSVNLGAATFNVDGALDLGSQVLSGSSGAFTLNSGATLITSNATGLNGAITVTGTKTFSTGANYEFRGAGTGSLLPSTVNNLTVNRSSGDVTLDGTSATQTVSSALNVYSGNLAAGVTTNTVSAGSLTMRNAQIKGGLTVTLGGNVTFDATSNGTAIIAGNLNLGDASRTFTVQDGSAATDMNVSGTLSNGDLIKSGAGNLSLSGDNSSFTGNIGINSGTLSVGHANALGAGTTTVNSGGTLDLGGLASSAKIALNNGTLLGGGAEFSGELSGSGVIGSLTLTSSAIIEWSLANPADLGTANKFTLGGALVLDGAAIQITGVSPTASGFWTSNQSWTVIASSEGHTVSGALAASIDNSSWSQYGSFSTSVNDGEVQLNWTATAIPEPSTYAMLAGGVALACVMIRRRRTTLPRA